MPVAVLFGLYQPLRGRLQEASFSMRRWEASIKCALLFLHIATWFQAFAPVRRARRALGPLRERVRTGDLWQSPWVLPEYLSFLSVFYFVS